MQANQLANDVVAHMMQNDLFSQWMGIKVIQPMDGYKSFGN